MDPGLPTFQSRAGVTTTNATNVTVTPKAKTTPTRVENPAQAQPEPKQASQRNLMGEFQKKMQPSAEAQKKNSSYLEKPCPNMDKLREIVAKIKPSHPVLAKHLEYGVFEPQTEGSAIIRLPAGSIHSEAFAANPDWLPLVQAATTTIKLRFEFSEEAQSPDTTLRSILSDERQAAEAKRIKDCIERPGIAAASEMLGAEVVHVELPK